MKNMTIMALSAAVALTAACASTPRGGMTASQFRDDPVMAGTWQSWDTNQDKLIDQEEFGRAMFDRVDTNRDGRLDQSEIYTITGGYPAFGTWESWDLNRDMRVDRDEFRTWNIGAGGMFTMWDTNRDMYLDHREMARGVFDTWDVNRNGVLEAAERRPRDPFFR